MFSGGSVSGGTQRSSAASTQPALLLQIFVEGHAFGGLNGSACTTAATPRQNLHARLRFFELLAAGLAQLHAFFEQFQRLIERQIAGLELLDDGLQFGESSLEAGHRFRIIRHCFYSTVADCGIEAIADRSE